MEGKMNDAFISPYIMKISHFTKISKYRLSAIFSQRAPVALVHAHQTYTHETAEVHGGSGRRQIVFPLSVNANF